MAGKLATAFLYIFPISANNREIAPKWGINVVLALMKTNMRPVATITLQALITFLLTEVCCASILNPVQTVTAPSKQAILIPDLPEGRWTGKITSRTIPDIDNDGEFQDAIALENCMGNAVLSFRKESGEYGVPIALEQIALPRTYLLMSASTENADSSGWSETQVWTLVNAMPNGWTISQSRSVINQQMKPDYPWFTFRRFAWGTLEFDPNWCEQK